MTRPWTRLFGAAALAATLATPSWAQYPDKPIRLVVPFAPGGGTDVVGRLMAERLGNALRQSIVVENKPGAGAMIGAAFVAAAPADGYTLLMGTSAELTIGPNMAASSRYDPVKDFMPVGMVGASPNVLLANPSFAPKNLREVAAYAKANPDKVSYGSGGAGTSPHMSGELLKTLGIPMTHISYKGSGPALTDLLSGQTQLMMSTMAPSLPLVKSGQVRPIAVTSLKRSPLLPDTPAVAESLPGYEAVTWYAVLAPAATPKPIVERLRAALDQVLRDKPFTDRLESMGISPDEERQTSEAIQQRIGKEMALWGRVIKQNNIKPE